jgi:hypothetical protein
LHPANQCEANFNSVGSIITGKKFTTSSTLNRLSPSIAFDRLSKVLLSEGFHIESSDPKRGLISAYQDVNLSSKRAPLNAIVEASPIGTKMTLVFVAAAGIYAPDAGAQGEFCNILNHVASN